MARYRKLFGGPLVANHGYEAGTGDALVGAGLADAVSFAARFIANPDLVSRLALGHELAEADRGYLLPRRRPRLRRLPDLVRALSPGHGLPETPAAERGQGRFDQRQLTEPVIGRGHQPVGQIGPELPEVHPALLRVQ